MRGRLEVVPYQKAPSPPMTPEIHRACERAIHVITPEGAILRAGRASLYVLAEIGWPRLARILRMVPFVWAIELGYWIVARNRRFFARFMFRKD